jgi:hypothetical protein
MSLKETVRIKTIGSHSETGIYEFKNSFQTRTNLVKLGQILGSYSILNT